MFGELLAKGKLSKVKDHSIGLGLANSALFADVLDGKLELVSSDEDGTKILLSIPVEAQEIARPPSDQNSFKSINNSSFKKVGRHSVSLMAE